jgi:hypothetical protein
MVVGLVTGEEVQRGLVEALVGESVVVEEPEVDRRLELLPLGVWRVRPGRLVLLVDGAELGVRDAMLVPFVL